MLDRQIESRLRCRYVSRGLAHLMLSPLKEEESLLVPRVVIYHDVISDSEIETIKNVTTSMVRPENYPTNIY